MFRNDLNLDERLLLLARTRAHSPAAERAVASFSRLGEHSAIWLAIGYAGALVEPDRERRREWRRARRAVLGAYALNTALKYTIRRRRPSLPGLPPLMGTTTGLSFPSAHAATSFAAARAYSRLGVPALPLYGAAGAMALSRLYLGVHYPTDVLAGALEGAVVAAVRAPRGTPPSGKQPGTKGAPLGGAQPER
ncbi:MAG: phosphatase PAP2 family protein [Solirubrobacteraceae bacterium]